MGSRVFARTVTASVFVEETNWNWPQALPLHTQANAGTDIRNPEACLARYKYARDLRMVGGRRMASLDARLAAIEAIQRRGK